MKPLLIKKIPLDEILKSYPISEKFLASYLKERPGILENPDIFYENYRSNKLPSQHKNFSLFQNTNKDLPETIYLCPVYLELYEYSGISPLKLIKDMSERYKSNRIIFQWNHDIDFSSKYLEVGFYDNVYIINFNTSIPTKNDILAPFWTINTQSIKSFRKHFAGFIASLNNNLRRALANTIKDKLGYYYISGLPYEEFLKQISGCDFTLCPRGVGLNSYRFYECFHLDTIPVLIADRTILPFEVNYDDICVRLPEKEIHNFKYMDNILHSIDQKKMKHNIELLREKFTLKGLQEEIHRRLS